jgi:hypothetical protein
MFKIHEDREGQLWYVGIYSNNFKDRDKETFEWDSHLEFAEWTKQTGVKLPITVLHQPKFPSALHLAQFLGLATGKFTAEKFSDNYMELYKSVAFAQTEAIIPLNGFMLVVGKILENKKDVAKLVSEAGWGMSHGYFKLSSEGKDIKKYRAFELTTLPNEIAANSITLTSVQEIKDTMDEMKLSQEDRDILEKVLTASPEEVEEATQKAHQILSDVISTKEVDETTEDEKEEIVPDSYEDVRNKLFSDLNVEGLGDTITKLSEGMVKITERLDGMETRVKETERSEDEKIASQFFVPNWGMVDSADSKEQTQEELLEELKEDALGTVEGMDEKAKDNPLFLGWHAPMGIQ